jgi:hypothetical protein
MRNLVGILGMIFTRVNGWGHRAHEVIALIASEFLTSTDRETIQHMMGLPLDSDLFFEQMASASTVADGWGKAQMAFHMGYSTVRKDGTIDLTCGSGSDSGKCLWTGIKMHTGIALDSASTQEQLLKAFQYIIHAMGDVFQPLHVGRLEDLSGSRIKKVYEQDEKWISLHKVWDSSLFYHGNKRDGTGAKNILSAACNRLQQMFDHPRSQPMTCLSNKAGKRDLTNPDLVEAIVKAFAEDSAKLAHSHAYIEVDGKGIVSNKALSGAYMDDRSELVKKLINRAGAELACYLRDLVYWYRTRHGLRISRTPSISRIHQNLKEGDPFFKVCLLFDEALEADLMDSPDSDELTEKELDVTVKGLGGIKTWPKL